MKRIALLLGLVFVFSACEVGTNIQSYPNPVPNKEYPFYGSYETKVLKDPSDSESELVDAVVIKWGYQPYQPAVYTTVLKYLVSEMEQETLTNVFEGPIIEWKSQISYRRINQADKPGVKGISDGVVEHTQVLILRTK